MDPQMDCILYREMSDSEAAFLRCMASGRGKEDFMRRWEVVLKRLVQATEAGQLSIGTLQACRSIVARVNAVASKLSDCELAAAQMVERMVAETQEHVKHLSDSPTLSTVRGPTSTPLQRLLPPQPNDLLLAPYRRWFLDHFAFPYLTAADKTALHLAVPSQTEAQCATWFINCRRRSGWGDLYKRFGGEKKEGMERFIREVDSPLTSWQVSEEAKREVEKVRDWFRDEEKNAVRRGIAEVVEQAGDIEHKGKILHQKKSRKPLTNLGVVTPKQEEFEEDLKVDPLPLPPLTLPSAPRNLSNSSLNSSSRNFSGLSHFSVDSSSTSASSFYSASPMAFELPYPADAFPPFTAERSAFVYPSSTQAPEPNPYFSTLADFPYATMNPLLAGQVSFS
ncbi:hypothetical protein BCR35DRAFT_341905 [Leucosporidium creatinivorum]|uniref:KN homeodomain domain-containing protein n=1 Tax=Leucosporidium creatinivorum TaxID=106004 RepID=A0A1Y2F4T4_9BASI|nr:hypothetical protein BCR35DRAFT_341905 [Leucosporidium creatinivorum]